MAWKTLSFLLTSILITSCGPAHEPVTSSLHIAGGTEVGSDSSLARSSVALYQLFSRWSRKIEYVCGATLVTRTSALTAAHCLRASSEAFYVVPGVAQASGGFDAAHPPREHLFGIVPEGKIIHPAYDEDVYETPDLAVVHFKGELPSGYQPASLASGKAPLGADATLTIASFGPTMRDGEDSGTLRRIDLPFAGIDPRDPSGKKLNAQGVSGTPGITSCPGDSGGSVYYEREGQIQLLGVLTGGRDGCHTQHAGENASVVQDIRGERDWILSDK